MTTYAPLFELDQHAVRCPHLVHAEMREEGPVVWVDEIEAFAVTRYDDILSVNRNPAMFSSRQATGPVLARQMVQAMTTLAAEDPEVAELLGGKAARGRTVALLNADPPLHSRQRGLVNRAFTLRAARAREDDIHRITDELIDSFIGAGRVELVHDFAVPLPLTVIAVALGVPVERMADFKRWSDDFVVAIGNHNLTTAELGSMVRSQAEFFEFFADQIEARRVEPRDDVISDVVAARLDGDELSVPEMLSMFSQFLVAGNETTTKWLASTTLVIAKDPALADRLRAAPEDVAPFLEEMLRLETPVQGLFRVANEDTEVGGVPVPARAAVWLVYAAGNRDDERFDAPDECIIGRGATPPHLAFGFGEHFCLGASLARAEARIGITALLQRLDDIALAVDDASLEYEPSYVLHGLKQLPLTFTAR